MKIISTEVKQLQPIETIALQHIGPYQQIGGVFEKLGAWAGTQGLWAQPQQPRMMGVYHDDPCTVPAAELRSDACLEALGDTQPGEGMRRYTIDGGKYMVMRVEVTMSEYSEAWMAVYETFNKNGYQYDARNHYEVYVSCAGDTQSPDAPWLVDLCIPTK